MITLKEGVEGERIAGNVGGDSKPGQGTAAR
jgi:hypothetical protein